jgi:hypothetical protein
MGMKLGHLLGKYVIDSVLNIVLRQIFGSKRLEKIALSAS